MLSAAEPAVLSLSGFSHLIAARSVIVAIRTGIALPSPDGLADYLYEPTLPQVGSPGDRASACLAGRSPFGHVLARPGLPMRNRRTSALRHPVQAICPWRTEEITIFPVSGSFAAKAEPICSYLAPGRSFGRSGPSPWRLIRIGDPASVGRDLAPGSDPNRLNGEPLVIEARPLPVSDRCLIAIGSPYVKTVPSVAPVRKRHPGRSFRQLARRRADRGMPGTS